MSAPLIYLDPDSDLSLQAQIRQKLVEAISSGIFEQGRRLPSSRKLAEQLGVARNTVVLVYEQLIEEAYLISRERSGIYVNSDMLEGRAPSTEATYKPRQDQDRWKERFKTPTSLPATYLYPPHWHQHHRNRRGRLPPQHPHRGVLRAGCAATAHHYHRHRRPQPCRRHRMRLRLRCTRGRILFRSSCHSWWWCKRCSKC